VSLGNEYPVNAPQPALEQIADGVWAWIGARGDSNAGAFLTADGLVAVDAQQTVGLATAFREAVEKAAGRPVETLVNTHFHLDHTAGNVRFADVPILAHRRTSDLMAQYLGAGSVWQVSDVEQKLKLFFGSNIRDLVPAGTADEAWFVQRMSGPDYDRIALHAPTRTFGDSFAFRTGNGDMRLDYWGPAHCDGDLIVWSPSARVALLGDLMFNGRFPWLGDCDLDGWIAQLGRVLTLDIEKVVPGHGPVTSLKEVAAFRDLLAALRGAVAAAIANRSSEEAAAREVDLPRYAGLPRYKEWMPLNVKAVYRYLKSR
jgi:glyoxylase-like metal-dependent hydrolase (beta-lactamase superfamily II)